jgi:hypothetical protein
MQLSELLLSIPPSAMTGIDQPQAPANAWIPFAGLGARFDHVSNSEAKATAPGCGHVHSLINNALPSH